jgi:hypothetical protein
MIHGTPGIVLIALMGESALVVTSAILLVQPRPLLELGSETARRLATMSGMFFLCVTFVWSVILGCILAMRELSMRV